MKTLRTRRQFLAMICAILVPMITLADEQILRLDRAEFVLDDAELPPPDSAAWKPQQLPDNWNVSRPQASGFGWYRIRFVLAQVPTQLYAIYAPKVSIGAAFYLNGQYLGSGGVFAPPATFARNQ